MVVVYVTCAFLIQLFNARSGRFADDPAGNVGLLLAFSAYMATGLLIILRRPGNAMGWILSSIGLLVMIGALAGEYVAYVVEARMVDAPALIPAAWLAEWYWYPTLALVLFFTPLLFPDGTPVSRRWRPVLWLGIAVTGVITVMAALSENLGEPDFSLPNPVGFAGMPDVEDSTIGSALFILLAALDPRCGVLGGGAIPTLPGRRAATAQVVHIRCPRHRADTGRPRTSSSRWRTSRLKPTSPSP